MSHAILYATEKEGQWEVRRDCAHGPKPYQREHVHITKKGLGGTYSWNCDGTRHDKHDFPSSEKGIKKAKELAAKRLGVPIDTLQLITGFNGGGHISVYTISDEDGRGRRLLFYSYARQSEKFVFFGSDNGLVLVIADWP